MVLLEVLPEVVLLLLEVLPAVVLPLLEVVPVVVVVAGLKGRVIVFQIVLIVFRIKLKIPLMKFVRVLYNDETRPRSSALDSTSSVPYGEALQKTAVNAKVNKIAPEIKI